jgi:hypothetical protein
VIDLGRSRRTDVAIASSRISLIDFCVFFFISSFPLSTLSRPSSTSRNNLVTTMYLPKFSIGSVNDSSSFNRVRSSLYRITHHIHDANTDLLRSSFSFLPTRSLNHSHTYRISPRLARCLVDRIRSLSFQRFFLFR